MIPSVDLTYTISTRSQSLLLTMHEPSSHYQKQGTFGRYIQGSLWCLITRTLHKGICEPGLSAMALDSGTLLVQVMAS